MNTNKNIAWVKPSKRPEQNCFIVARIEALDLDVFGVYDNRNGGYIRTGESGKVPFSSISLWARPEIREKKRKKYAQKKEYKPGLFGGISKNQYDLMKKKISEMHTISDRDSHDLIRKYYNGTLSNRAALDIDRIVLSIADDA